MLAVSGELRCYLHMTKIGGTKLRLKAEVTTEEIVDMIRKGRER